MIDKTPEELLALPTCLHDETERLGAIWKRCTQCGKKWADDEAIARPVPQSLQSKPYNIADQLIVELHESGQWVVRVDGFHKYMEGAQAHCRNLKHRYTDQPESFAYACPVSCGCLWRDNKDGTMSLFGAKSTSCAVCEALPLCKLLPLSAQHAAQAQPQPVPEQKA